MTEYNSDYDIEYSSNDDYDSSSNFEQDPILDEGLKSFYIEDEVRNIFFNIKELSESCGLFNNLNHTGELLYFLHPDHNPLF